MPNIIDAVSSMRAGKSADDEGMQAEHFIHAPFNLLVRLMLLFNSMLCHAFVPSQFRCGSIIPIIKDKQSSHRNVDKSTTIGASQFPP